MNCEVSRKVKSAGPRPEKPDWATVVAEAYMEGYSAAPGW
jgi:hypothetical protein